MNEVVKYHNDFSNKIILKNFTANELNFLMAICSKMKNQETNEVVFDFSQLKELVKWDNNNNKLFIESLENTNRKLIALNFRFEDEKKIIQFVLFPTFEIDKEQKTLTVSVNEKFAYLLNGLSSNFTRFELENFTTLQSKYSKILYKELMKFKSTGYLIMTIDDFRNKLDIPLKYRMTHINEKVLTPAKEELSKILKKFEIKKLKKGKNISHIEFTFNPIKNIENIEEIEIIEICEIERYWLDNFPGVNYSKKHKEKIEKFKKKHSISYIKKYLQEQWDYVKNNPAIENGPAYFSQLILEEKAVFKDYEELNKKEYIDPEEDKIQAENFVGTLFENIEKNTTRQEEKIEENIEIEQQVLFIKEITKEEYEELYRNYLEKNSLEDNEFIYRTFKMMSRNKYKIIEKKIYTVEDIPEEKLLSKSGKKLVGAALQMKISKILEEMNK